jgi:hypothetical protein
MGWIRAARWNGLETIGVIRLLIRLIRDPSVAGSRMSRREYRSLTVAERQESWQNVCRRPIEGVGVAEARREVTDDGHEPDRRGNQAQSGYARGAMNLCLKQLSSTAATLQLADAVASFLHLRLQIGIGVLPQLDELRVVRQRLVDIALRVVQFTEAAMNRRQPRRPLPDRDRAGPGVSRIHGNRRVGLAGEIVSQAEIRESAIWTGTTDRLTKRGYSVVELSFRPCHVTARRLQVALAIRRLDL